MRRWLFLLLLVAASPATALAQGGPAWLAEAAGSFSGLVRNAGRMECHRTVFALQGGQFVGHYWIDAEDPFEGELTDFRPVPDDDGAGTFTWTDRYGAGVMYVRFAGDYARFAGFWGMAAPDPRNPVGGSRGGVAGCTGAVS